MRRHGALSKDLALKMFLICISSAIAVAHCDFAAASSVSWVGPNNGEWDVAGNWSTGAVPISTDDVIDSLGNTSIVTNPALQSISIGINSLTNNAGGTVLNEYGSSLAIYDGLDNSNSSQFESNGINDSNFTTSSDVAGSLDNNGAVIESINGGDITMTGGTTSDAINDNGGVIEALGENTSYSSLLQVGNSGGVGGTNFVSLTNENNSTIEALSAGQLEVSAGSITNDATSKIESSGSSNGGLHSNIFIYTGTSFTNMGMVMVSQGGSLSDTSSSQFTNGSTGTLEVTDANSSVGLSVSELDNTGTIMVLNNGSLNINSDINQSAGLTKISSNSTLSLTGYSAGPMNFNFNLNGGTLEGANGTITGNVNQNGGTFNSGLDPADFNISGNYTLSSGELSMEVASLTSYDKLLVSGNTSISGGTLYLDFINGFHPSSGETFDLITSTGGIAGGFTSVDSNLNGSYSFNNGILTINGAPPVPECGSTAAFLLLLAPVAALTVRKSRAASC